MLRKLVEHALVEKLDPDAVAQSAEEGAEIASELVRQNPDLAEFLIPKNQDAIETRMAGQGITFNTLREAVLSLAAAGKLDKKSDIEHDEQEARRIVEERLHPKQPRSPETGRFTVSEDFRVQYNGMTAAEIRRRYFSDPEFKKKVDALEGVTAQPQSVPQEEPVLLTAEQWRSLPSHVAQRKMNNSAAFRAAVDRLIAERKI